MIRRLRSLPSIQSLLIVLLLAIAGFSAQSLAPEGIEVRLWTIAIAAGLLGIVLGLLRTADSVSHLLAIVGGLGGVVALAAMRLSGDIEPASFIDRVGAVADELRDWYLGTIAQERSDDLLVIILLQMVVWLTSYLAAWSLVRRGWLTVAVLLPGILVVTARVLARDQADYSLEGFLVVAIMLLARTTFLKRAGTSDEPDERPMDRRGWVSLIVAAFVALAVVTVGLATPEDFSEENVQPVAEYASQVYLNAQEQAIEWVGERLDLTGTESRGIDDFPRYTAFDDAFSVGGEINLTDQPEVVVRTGGAAPYLSAQSYDTYNGRGWESTVEQTFQADGPDGVRYAPELTFQPGQEVPYTSAVSDERAEMSMQVTPLSPSGDTMFSTGMYLTADERASVRMSWLQLDNTVLALRDMNLSEIPVDLIGIASLLIQAPDLTVEGDDGLFYPSQLDARSRLQDARAQHADRFIDVTWTVAADGRVDAMIVTGQVPVYDNNVTVKRTDDSGINGSYTVISLRSTTDETMLRSASTEYPAWAEEQYLDLPSTVTPRTAQLVNELAAGTENSYDRAKIIEGFLRNHIVYDLQVDVPPEDADIVDYVLFEMQRGYCEHYASAMTVMMRLLGIPAKTVVGYYPGEFDESVNGYLYRQENAHAWTEVYFPGYGWIRFEPTSSQPASSLDDVTEIATPTPTPVPTIEPQVETATPPVATPVEEDEAAPVAELVPDEPAGGDGGMNWPVLVGIPVLLASVSALAAWWLFTRSSALEPTSMFRTMVRWGRAAGVSSDPTTTPREYAQSFGRRYPEFAHDANDIVDVYEEHAYGGREPEQTRIQQAAEALRHLRREVLRRVVRLRR